jgi:hypothetical protein
MRGQQNIKFHNVLVNVLPHTHVLLSIVFCFDLEIQFKLGHPQPPESVCSLPCSVGQAKKYVEGESCCWHCFNCTQYQVTLHFLTEWDGRHVRFNF